MSAEPHTLARTADDTAAAPLDSLSMPFRNSTEVDLLLDDLQTTSGTPLDAVGVPSQAALAGRRGGAGRFVLVVDGTSIARKFLSLRLQSLGYQVQVAEDGEQALALVEARAYAIVFLELALGPKDGMDGLRLCQAIKQKPDHPNGVAPAVVVVTGLVGSTDRVRGALAGCDAYLTKPLIKEDLIVAMGEVDPLFN